MGEVSGMIENQKAIDELGSLITASIINNAKMIGIVTGVDKPDGNVEQVRRWLHLCGCEKIFEVSSYSGQGLTEIIEYLREPGDAPDARPV